MKVLWLASWYPDEFEPTNGDFVRRHAKAVSQFMDVDVIHVVQAGKDFTTLSEVEVDNDGSLREFIHYFAFKKTGMAWLDKIRYNKTYLSYYTKILHEYIKEKGKPDLIHVHVPMKAGMVALRFLKLSNIPYIVSEHSSLYLETAKDNFYNRSFYFRRQTKRIFKHAALVTNVSSAIGKVLEDMFGLKNVRIIPNVVDTNYFYFKPRQPNKVFRWLHVSTMYPLKNVDKIIRAFNELPPIKKEWELIICGPVNKEYEQLVKQLQLQSKIKFTGEISYEQVAAEMQKADAFILFSRHENFPCVVIEALCCGLRVVASNVGGIPEAVNETNGILVEPENVSALQNAITTIMQYPTKYSNKNISEAAISKYNYQVIAKQFIAAYDDVLRMG
ncbi:MAG TPA: glycosyltransferase [Parafilimonas sp.]|nr:glycosyltransferase [Parafilimonas sp.]